MKQAKGPVYSMTDKPWWDWDEQKQVGCACVQLADGKQALAES